MLHMSSGSAHCSSGSGPLQHSHTVAVDLYCCSRSAFAHTLHARSHTPQAVRKFVEITEAFETLSVAAKRREAQQKPEEEEEGEEAGEEAGGEEGSSQRPPKRRTPFTQGSPFHFEFPEREVEDERPGENSPGQFCPSQTRCNAT